MSLWLNDADARTALRLAKGTLKGLADPELRAATERLIRVLGEKLDPDSLQRAYRRKGFARTSLDYRDRRRWMAQGRPEVANCKGCNAPIRWEVTKNGKPTPVDADGTPHWATCPARDRFKKPKGRAA